MIGSVDYKPAGTRSPARASLIYPYEPTVYDASSGSINLDLRPVGIPGAGRMEDFIGNAVRHYGRLELQQNPNYGNRTGLRFYPQNSGTLNASVLRIPTAGGAYSLSGVLFCIEIDFTANLLQSCSVIDWMGMNGANYQPISIRLNTVGGIELLGSTTNSSLDLANARTIGVYAPNTPTVLRLLRTSTQYKTYVNGQLTDTLTNSSSPHAGTGYDVFVGAYPVGVTANPTSYSDQFDGFLHGLRFTRSVSRDPGANYVARPSPAWG